MRVSFTIPLGRAYRKAVVALVGAAAQTLPPFVHGHALRWYQLGVAVLTLLGVYWLPNGAVLPSTNHVGAADPAP